MAIGIGIELTEANGHTTVRVHGDVDMETAPHLDDVLAGLPREARIVVIDLSDVEFVDSSGLTVLVEHWQRLERRVPGAEIRLVVARPTVSRVLDVAGLAQVFKVFATYDDAVRGL